MSPPRQHPIHKLSRSVRHAAPSARRAEAPALAREGNQSIKATRITVHTHKPMGQDPAGKKVPELAFDKARHCPLTRLRPGQEGFEFRRHDPIKDTLFGPTAGVPLGSGTIKTRTGGRQTMRVHSHEPLPTSCPTLDPQPSPNAPGTRSGTGSVHTRGGNSCSPANRLRVADSSPQKSRRAPCPARPAPPPTKTPPA